MLMLPTMNGVLAVLNRFVAVTPFVRARTPLPVRTLGPGFVPL